METETAAERPRAGRPTQAEAARLAERLRQSAVDTFLEQGYDGATMEAVARAAGITKRTLYARYPDKRALFLDVVQWALARQRREESTPDPAPDDPAPDGPAPDDPAPDDPAPDDLAAGLTTIARSALARALDPDVIRLSRMAMAESSRFPEFATSAHSLTWSPRMRIVMDLLRSHLDRGTVAIEDVELAAEQFLILVSAMPARLAAFGVFRTADDEERHLRHAVALFLNGVLARES